ncbi:MAG: site-2 protease family protein [Candidatus Niyogibacteria bacterium CG10_big_fil_rev_8_21_14_0_10_46_36]|uniref:Site-2 protease family protein n=1 Tax=Candidatus Niyogibacteria bacterium CG10_big_fil_rev_8_21_14_0_10_46_36 TaxID=1974726 RepID=A0A2H0TE01_9BACT|nr:MAG: site-2 protease family protein [Candidatus Niyogibacteria bacterium CG10_big_fil_rev_8_21_14_0_10_46_36]
MSIDIIFIIAIVIMSAIIHEFSHGYAALMLGDPTAKHQGRLTLNPIPHIDPIGSILVPFVLAFFGGFIIAWAKPVPFNPYNLSNQKWGPAIVAVAGPLSNIIIAVFFGVVIRMAGILALPAAFVQVLFYIVFINIILAVFNLVPIPPLDGSKILFSALPYRWMHIQRFLEQYGFFLVLVFILFFWQLISPVIVALFSLITGIPASSFF